MNEEKVVVAAPLLPPVPDLSTLVPPKRKKGRPPKNRDLVPAGENITIPPPPKPDGRGRKPKRKNGDMAWPTVDSAFVGQQVHGVLDGSFDAGYLLTVRVGNTQTVLRGAVFEPTLSVPISQANDIAPRVKFISRSEQVAPLLPCSEERVANPALPSVAAPPPINSGIIETAPTGVAPTEGASLPMEEERPLEPPSSEPGVMPTAATTEYHKETPFLAKDHATEEKVDLHTQQQQQPLQTDVVDGHEKFSLASSTEVNLLDQTNVLLAGLCLLVSV
ncbi:hypothetical protein GOP47_0011241 [Adiantum capillus-veneris]|uniref:AT hook motif-containing protein n=1 Tax=Adiantum capillus-veneris TaxID=13818 RepID=A0A9D4USF3_ADICA|nr:hypothetical protein GOP47_0011241 [Adiantum capillus-veneris]